MYSSPMSLVKSIATVGGFTAISRAVGFIRDILMARFLGASLMADAFFVALRFPNLFRSLFAEGTLNVAFVPMLSGKLHENKQRAIVFARSVFSFLFYILLLFVVVVEIIMPATMFLMAPGFDEIPGKLALTTTLSRITFPFLLFVSLVSLLAGILNSLGKFWAAAFTPTILNLSMITGLVFLTPYIRSDFAPAYALAWGVFAAGVVEFLFLLWHLKRAKFTFGLLSPTQALFHLSKDVKILLKRMGPGVLGSGMYQINLFLDTLLVSFVGAGAISWLNYAHHLFQLPIGIIGVAVGTALLPVMSKHIKAGELDQANTHLNRGLEISLAMSLASLIGLVALARPIVRILFEHGAFLPSDTYHTSTALMIFACGLPAYMMTKALSPFFYARGDTVTPVKISIIGIILNIILALSLMQFWGYAGIALATTLTVWFSAGQYWIRLRNRGDFKLDATFKYRLPRILFACTMMALFLWGADILAHTLIPNWASSHRILSVGILSALIIGAIGVFGFGLIACGGIPLTQIKSFFQKRRNS